VRCAQTDASGVDGPAFGVDEVFPIDPIALRPLGSE
jgi:hypothetical protein